MAAPMRRCVFCLDHFCFKKKSLLLTLSLKTSIGKGNFKYSSSSSWCGSVPHYKHKHVKSNLMSFYMSPASAVSLETHTLSSLKAQSGSSVNREYYTHSTINKTKKYCMKNLVSATKTRYYCEVLPVNKTGVSSYSNQPKPKQNYADEEENESSDFGSKKEQLEQKQNIWTVPNFLTSVRIAMAPLLGYLVLHESYHLACGMFIVAGVSDLLDGYIARTWPSQTSALGSFLDPLADKLLINILFATLTMVNLIPVPLTVLVISRDVGLVIAAFYVRFISLPPPITFYRFFDGSNATAQLKPTTLSKVNTAIQLFLVTLTVAAPVFEIVNHPVLQAIWYLTASTTILTAFQYMAAKDTYRIIKKKNTDGQ